MSAPARRRVAVAGAGGFVGTALCPRLAENHEVIALTRSPARAATPDPQGAVTWRLCDLFSLQQVTAALAGVDLAVWLVHSLAPSSRLTQASARDLDLVLADTFGAACAAAGVRQIVMVSSVLPAGYDITPVLWSRREVELALADHGTPVTALRASLIVGPGGTGPALLVDLVRRLPLLLLPTAARSLTRPVALADLVRAILHVLDRPAAFTGAFDVGGADCLSYREMLRQTAAVLGRRRLLLTLPGLPLWLTGLVARLVSGAPGPLVAAVVESLPRDLQMQDNPVQRAIDPAAQGFRAALLTALDPARGRLRPNPRAPIREVDREVMRQASLVRSIQRVLLPPGADAAWVAGNYFTWLGRCCGPLVGADRSADGRVRVTVPWLGLRLLELTPMHAESSPRRQVYRITGGLLARGNPPGRPRFEFQTLLGGRYTMTAIHDYAPALPWWLYLPTQAFLHLRVMRRYQARLARLAR